MGSSVENSYAVATILAWDRKLEASQLINLATELEDKNFKQLAAALYYTWLQRNQTQFNHFVWFNLGVLLFSQQDYYGAKNAYENAIAIAPKFLQSKFNLGLVFEKIEQCSNAIKSWTSILEHADPTDTDQRNLLILALNNLGRVHESNKEYKSSLECLNNSLQLNPNQPDVLHHWIFIREKLCAWPVYADIPSIPIEQQRDYTSALALLSLTDDPEAQLTAAKNYVTRKMATDFPPLAPKNGYNHKKIRIGYCSSDFCLHPIAMLTVELFELHDRKNFEIYAFCWTQDDGSELRKRVINSVENFIRIDELDDISAAELIRKHEIDILIDLHGQTKGARTHIFAHRPAPVQITYLGLPATTGLPCIDYVIADKFLIPKKYAKHYSEIPLYMPDVYQVSDRKRISSPEPTREKYGLPENSFVFCCFNNNYKYTPEMFSIWMNILRQTPGSVLWLLADTPYAQANLIKEASIRGIDTTRLVFAPRESPSEYLGRYQIADLFLDSFPFNGGTTANDALWMELPVLTLSGRAFASRMAGALLTSAGLEELITYNHFDYQNKAVMIAQSPNELQKIKNKLKIAKEQSALFDTKKFTKNLEKIFKKIRTVNPQIENI